MPGVRESTTSLIKSFWFVLPRNLERLNDILNCVRVFWHASVLPTLQHAKGLTTVMWGLNVWSFTDVEGVRRANRKLANVNILSTVHCASRYNTQIAWFCNLRHFHMGCIIFYCDLMTHNILRIPYENTWGTGLRNLCNLDTFTISSVTLFSTYLSCFSAAVYRKEATRENVAGLAGIKKTLSRILLVVEYFDYNFSHYVFI